MNRRTYSSAAAACLLALPLIVAGCKDKTPPPPPAAVTPAPPPAPAPDSPAPETFRVKLVTSKGDVVIEANRAWAPKGADRFYRLVSEGYFTDVRFFRVLKGFMAQFGINGDPALTAKYEGMKIMDDPVTQSNTRGMVTFATAGPNTRANQFFINYGNNASLDGQGFAPFGKVVDGMKVVDALYAEYGEGADMGGQGPFQGRATKEGNAYLTKEFPKLDYIKSATILPPAAAAK
jgi:peptidyl-prolyl cis-trans isomerase A (cyclophilin A)